MQGLSALYSFILHIRFDRQFEARMTRDIRSEYIVKRPLWLLVSSHGQNSVPPLAMSTPLTAPFAPSLFTVIVPAPLIIAALVSTAFAPAPFIPVLAVSRLILGRLHEIHRPVTGIVFLAMFGPVLCMTRWHVQIDRLIHRPLGLLDNDHRLRVDDRRRWRVAKLHSAIDARSNFTANRDIDSGYICCKGPHAAKQEGGCHYLKYFHDVPFRIDGDVPNDQIGLVGD